jgi:hypothetical protein
VIRLNVETVIEPWDVEKASAELEKLSEAARRGCRNLISDLAYFEDMRRLEAHPEEKTLDCVPITGLLIGSFMRMKVQHETCLEVWSKSN